MISLRVTAEAAARYDETDPAPVLAVAGHQAELTGHRLRIRAQDGGLLDVRPGDRVIRYAPGDVGVMSDGAYRRYFGN